MPGVTATSEGPRASDQAVPPVGRVMAALAEPRRASIIALLEQRHRSQRGLSRALDMSQPLLSHHLRVLREAGLITSTKCDRITVYLLNAATLRSLSARLQLLTKHAETLEAIKPC